MSLKSEKNIQEVQDDKSLEQNQSRRGLLITSLIRFFDIPENLEQLLNIIQGKSNISLRLLDWFITNYAKTNNIVYTIEIGEVKKQFNVYLNYKTQLKAYSKKQFDPFQRRERIKFQIKQKNDERKDIITTIGQLNFFRWAIQNNIIEYAQENASLIEKDMNNSILLRKESQSNYRNKRKDATSTLIQQYPINQVSF